MDDLHFAVWRINFDEALNVGVFHAAPDLMQRLTLLDSQPHGIRVTPPVLPSHGDLHQRR